MSKKKKPSAKQTKQNLQKPTAKPAKEAAAPKKATTETAAAKETTTKPAKEQASEAKEKKSEQIATKAAKPEVSKSKPEVAAKPEPAQTKVEPSTSKQAPAKADEDRPKQTAKDAGQKPTEAKKKEDVKPQAKGQKGGKSAKKKDKTPRQSEETAPRKEEPAAQESEQQEPEQVSTPVSEENPGPEPSETGRKVSKTLVDEETDFTPPPAEVRKVAKTVLEVNIGGLKEAAAKATGTDSKEETLPPQQRKVAKTLLETSTDGLRDAVEASSLAIEDEIAAAIRESEAEQENQTSVETPGATEPSTAERMVAEAAKNPEVKPADRKIAKTMLDFRADEFFELANSEIDTLMENSPADAAPLAAAIPAAPVVPPEPPPQPRKVARTMLEMDAPDANAIVEAVQAAAMQTDGQAPASNYDEVSMDDLSEFAQALKEDKPMSAPNARAERLRKTMLGIRKHGLASSASMSGVTGEANQPEIPAPDAPVRISRSLHPLDNFSFDNLCPADDEVPSTPQTEIQLESQPDSQAYVQPEPQSEADPEPPYEAQSEQQFAPQIEQLANSQSEPESDSHAVAESGTVEMDSDPHQVAERGTVEMDHDPHQDAAGGEFKGTETVWPHDQEQQQQEQKNAEAREGTVKPERFVPKTMLDMDFLKESLSASVSRAEEKMAESIALKASEPQKATLTSDDYKLTKPNCPFVWADGDLTKDKVRYCTQCSSQIYNFAGFDKAEAQSLIFKRENRENAHIYKREDGKFMTNDCPIAVKKHKDKSMLIGGAVLAVILLVVMMVGSLMSPHPATTPSANSDSAPPAPNSPIDDTASPSVPSAAGDGTSPAGTKTSTKYGKGGGMYVKGKGVVEQAPVIVAPADTSEPAVPGTTSGYDEGGQFWKYTDKGNN